jgi:DNA-binding CsgD family transcriptional regulator
MTTVFEHPIVCPVLIGRAAHVQALTRCIAGARDGRGQMVLVAGEAGIGKSRLVAEAKLRAGEAGLVVLQGNSFEPDRALPYAPLREMLREVVAGRQGVLQDAPPALHDNAGPAASEVARLVPDLAALLPEETAPVAADAPQEKRRLFQALVQVFSSLAARAPLLAVLEDLHWSDDASLEFLLHLARGVGGLPMLLLCTYRSDEVHAGLQHLLAGLDRERLATEMTLPRLEPAEVDTMLRAIFDLKRPPAADFLHVLYSLTEGNPFFIEETLTSLRAAGEISAAGGEWARKPVGDLRIPRTVQDAVDRRMTLLTPPARQVLVLAAVAGRRFPFDLLQQLTRLDERELLQQIKELIAAQLVVETPDEQFAFRHALTRQAVYATLLARERRALHREIAQMLERASQRTPASTLDAHLEDLGYHFAEAGVWDRALEHARRAGERAQALHAPRAAIEQFSRAIEAAGHLALAPPSLYRGRGLAYETLGDFDRALGDHEAALLAARQAGDRREEWRSLMNLGGLWAGRDYAQTGGWYRQATELAEELADADLHAHSLNRLGNWLLNTGRAEESLRAHHAALELFRARDSRQGMAETLDLLSMSLGQAGDTRQAVERATAAIDLFRGLGDRRSLSSCLAGRAAFSSAVVDCTLVSALRGPADCERDTAEALQLARQIDFPAGQAYAGIAAGQALGGFGQFGAALTRTQEALRLATEIGHQQWIAGAHSTLGAIYLAMLAPDAAVEALEAALSLALALGSVAWTSLVSADLALAHLLRRDWPRAEGVLGGEMARDARAPMGIARRVTLAWGELALARGHHESALRTAQDLIDSVPGQGTGTLGQETRSIPALLKLKGEALMALGRVDEAAEALEEAGAGALGRGARPLAWQVHRSLGRVRRAGKRADEAERADAMAREIIAQMAATIEDEGLRAGFLAAALASLPREKHVSPLRAAKQSYGGLTAREREVAALIGQGRSNREVAEALVLSERTVATHVGNILAKLDFTSRAQIAVWARDKGLLSRE